MVRENTELLLSAESGQSFKVFFYFYFIMDLCGCRSKISHPHALDFGAIFIDAPKECSNLPWLVLIVSTGSIGFLAMMDRILYLREWSGTISMTHGR